MCSKSIYKKDKKGVKMSEYTKVLKDSMLILVESIITDRDSLAYYANNKGGSNDRGCYRPLRPS